MYLIDLQIADERVEYPGKRDFQRRDPNLLQMEPDIGLVDLQEVLKQLGKRDDPLRLRGDGLQSAEVPCVHGPEHVIHVHGLSSVS